MQEGLAVVLRASGTPGIAGAAADVIRVGFGTRVLLAALMGTLLHQPPVAVLLQQAAIMWLVRADYCRWACRLGRAEGRA